jgi:hypothetical protein
MSTTERKSEHITYRDKMFSLILRTLRSAHTASVRDVEFNLRELAKGEGIDHLELRGFLQDFPTLFVRMQSASAKKGRPSIYTLSRGYESIGDVEETFRLEKTKL